MSNQELVNYIECGDARGRRWLDVHPEARERAEQSLRDVTIVVERAATIAR